MRKMMNKKGFSLVELMIVVVIMGILIAVAIPLYGAITDNANAKTCGNNVKVIKNTCANYFSSYEQDPIPSKDALADMMEEGAIPYCPLDSDKTDSYTIYVNQKTGAAKVDCVSDHSAKAVEGEGAPEASEIAASVDAVTETAVYVALS